VRRVVEEGKQRALSVCIRVIDRVIVNIPINYSSYTTRSTLANRIIWENFSSATGGQRAKRLFFIIHQDDLRDQAVSYSRHQSAKYEYAVLETCVRCTDPTYWDKGRKKIKNTNQCLQNLLNYAKAEDNFFVLIIDIPLRM
jgi:hypothetical protein